MKNINDNFTKKLSAELPLVQNKLNKKNIDKNNNKFFKEDSEVNIKN